MAKPKLARTIASTIDDPLINRALQVRRDTDNVKTPKVTLFDIDYAIYSFLRNKINPRIIENKKTIPVPIIFSNGETWAQIQKHGYNRNIDGTVNRPLITIKRSGNSDRDDVVHLDVMQNPDGNTIATRTKYSKNNTYDRFSILNNVKPTYTYYNLNIPEYIMVTYEIIIWTDFTEQLNSIMEQIIPTSRFAWGDDASWKFITMVRDFTIDTINSATEQRVVRASSTLDVKGYLLASHEFNQSTMQKSFSIKRVVFNQEIVVGSTSINNMNDGLPSERKQNRRDRRTSTDISSGLAESTPGG